MSKHHPFLQCRVENIEYDYSTETGSLYLADVNCCDMSGCIRFFMLIDPEVKFIYTFAGSKPDTAYRLQAGRWQAGVSEM